MCRFLTMPRVSGVSGVGLSGPVIDGELCGGAPTRQAFNNCHALGSSADDACVTAGAAPPASAADAVAAVIFRSGRLLVASSELNSAFGVDEVVRRSAMLTSFFPAAFW